MEGSNLYRSCHNDPVNKSDPMGLDMILLSQWSTAGGQGHTASVVGNDETGWHFFEKQGGEGLTTGNVHREFGSLEKFRVSTLGDGYSNATRVTTDKEKDGAMVKYGQDNYNKPYHVSGENCSDLSAGIAEKAGLSPSWTKVPFSNMTRPNTLASEVAKHGSDTTRDVHTDLQREREKPDPNRWKTGPRF